MMDCQCSIFLLDRPQENVGINSFIKIIIRLDDYAQTEITGQSVCLKNIR